MAGLVKLQLTERQLRDLKREQWVLCWRPGQPRPYWTRVCYDADIQIATPDDLLARVNKYRDLVDEVNRDTTDQGHEGGRFRGTLILPENFQ